MSLHWALCLRCGRSHMVSALTSLIVLETAPQMQQWLWRHCKQWLAANIRQWILRVWCGIHLVSRRVIRQQSLTPIFMLHRTVLQKTILVGVTPLPWPFIQRRQSETNMAPRWIPTGIMLSWRHTGLKESSEWHLPHHSLLFHLASQFGLQKKAQHQSQN